MRKITFLTGFAAGYVLGTRAGRERYEQISRTAQRVMSNPKVQQTTDAARSTVKTQASGLASTAKDQATGLAGTAKDKVSSKIDERRHSGDQGSDAGEMRTEGFGAPTEDSVFVVDLNDPVATSNGSAGAGDRMGL